MKKMDGVSTSFPTPLVDSSYVEYRDLLTKFFSNTKGVDICRNYAVSLIFKNSIKTLFIFSTMDGARIIIHVPSLITLIIFWTKNLSKRVNVLKRK